VVTAAHVIDGSPTLRSMLGGLVGNRLVQIVVDSTRPPAGGRRKDRWDFAFWPISAERAYPKGRAMQFVKDGPDIPDALLHQHEDGAVIFFCGAGISYPAGLPDFKTLVSKIYARLNDRANATEKQAQGSNQFDTVLDLLQHRVGRKRVRDALAAVLTPKLKQAGATDTHKALLTLARTIDEESRLVTTNLDVGRRGDLRRRGR
jgi:hypothetical protein